MPTLLTIGEFSRASYLTIKTLRGLVAACRDRVVCAVLGRRWRVQPVTFAALQLC